MASLWFERAGFLVQGLAARRVSFHGLQVDLPFDLTTRMSILAGNLRVQRLIDASTRLGDTVVDVGAHIGLNTLYLAQRVGPKGHVTAIEPAADNLEVLRRNVAANHLHNVTVQPVAAGRVDEVADFFLRGQLSAVNSRFADSFYAPVSAVTRVTVVPLDDLVDAAPRLVKIDVEGGELDVIDGMARLLRAPGIQLIVEWHPALQEAAGRVPDALPRALWAHGFELRAASHRRVRLLNERDLGALLAHLQRHRRPVELWARR
jgi:FkbM family methyltransferase